MAKKKFSKPVKNMPKQPAPKPVAEAAPVAPKQPVAPTGDAVDSNDPIIAKVQDAVRGNIPADTRVAVQRVVLAGMKVMFSPETHQLMLKSIQSDTDPAHAVGMGVTQLVTLLFKQSKNTIPLPALIPAAVLLCCEALDFMEKANMVKVTPVIMANASQTVTAYLFQKMGYTPDKIAQIVKAGNGQQAGGAQPAPPQPAAAPAQPAPQGQPSGGLIGQQMGAQ